MAPVAQQHCCPLSLNDFTSPTVRHGPCACRSFFDSASNAAAAAGILWFLSYFPYFVIQANIDNATGSQKQYYCAISTTCMAIGANIIADAEGNGIGVTWASAAQQARSRQTPRDAPSLASFVGVRCQLAAGVLKHPVSVTMYLVVSLRLGTVASRAVLGEGLVLHVCTFCFADVRLRPCLVLVVQATMGDPSGADGEFSFQSVITMLIADTIWMLVLTLYVQNDPETQYLLRATFLVPFALVRTQPRGA